MALFKKKNPEEKKLKELTGGFSLSTEFISLLEENNLVDVFSKEKYAIGNDIKSILKRKIKFQQITVDEIEPEINLMIEKAKYIKENLSIIYYCPCGNEISKYHIFFCDKCEHNMFYEYDLNYEEIQHLMKVRDIIKDMNKLTNEEMQHRKKIMNIINDESEINLINKHSEQIKKFKTTIITESLHHRNWRLFFNYPKYYTKINGDNDDLICKLRRTINDNEQIFDITIEVSYKTHADCKFEKEHILENNGKCIMLNSWSFDILNEHIFFKGETENEIIYQHYYFPYDPYDFDKMILFSCSVPLDKYSNHVDMMILYDFRIISNKLHID